ncbi:(+)-neomenthol dehydrogenase-like isoform X3 [Arachis ipaensis]|uniref:(+)-neomenthol dehydrogenase-like isoform X3 n=1 Tax=Arachis ipaensis TaxID=130454 RepID=UPI000A2B0E05|nr:(+)-neomenthol dehydrogenase-like isoform X3 [Arachis ipaensis]
MLFLFDVRLDVFRFSFYFQYFFSKKNRVTLFSKLIRYAVVSGANKGIGTEIVRQLASNGVKVVLTSRDEKRDLHALETLKDLSHLVLFHQLVVADPATVDSLANFIKSEFGKPHILINNAGIGGLVIKDNDLVPQVLLKSRELSDDVIEKAGIVQTFELAEECLQIKYYGAKRISEALLPLLQLSESPRIMNVSSSLGKLKLVESLRRNYLEMNNFQDHLQTSSARDNDKHPSLLTQANLEFASLTKCTLELAIPKESSSIKIMVEDRIITRVIGGRL